LESGVVHFSSLSVLACVLRATTKKVLSFFGEKSAPQEKILPTPKNIHCAQWVSYRL